MRKLVLKRGYLKGQNFYQENGKNYGFKIFNDCYKLVLIGKCKNCKEATVSVYYYKYKEKMVLLEYNIPILVAGCNRCNANDKLLISTWDKKIKNS
jgi:hypothetical protein